MKTTFTKRIASVVTAVLAVSLLTLGTASAIGEGQIERGDFYRLKNLTKNSAFSDPAQADQCETVQYKARFHNPGPGVVNNVNVRATLPTTAATTQVSTMTVTGENMQPATISDTATLNISSSQKINYVTGSTELLDTNNNVVRNLPDGITGSGINIGNVGVSLNEIKFVQFKVKIDCPQPPEQPVYSCDAFTITVDKRTVKVATFSTTARNGATFKNATVEWGDNSTNLTKENIIGETHEYAKDGTYTITATARFTVDGQEVTANGPQCQQKVTFSPNKPPIVTPPTTPPAAPTKLVNTGPGSIAGIFAAVTVASALAHRKFMSRRLNAES